MNAIRYVLVILIFTALATQTGAAAGRPAKGGIGGDPAIAHQSPSATPAANAATNHSIINGTGMVRPGLGSGSIGGAAKSITGINGTGVHPKR